MSGVCGRLGLAGLPSLISQYPCPCRHLKQLLQDDARTQQMIRESNGVYLDFSRQNAQPETVEVCGGAAASVAQAGLGCWWEAVSQGAGRGRCARAASAGRGRSTPRAVQQPLGAQLMLLSLPFESASFLEAFSMHITSCSC